MCMSVCMDGMWMYVCKCVCMYGFMCVCVCMDGMWMNVCMSRCRCVYVHVWMEYIRLYVYMY